MSNPASALVVSDGQRAALEVVSKSQTASHREVQRAQVLLMAAKGLANEWIPGPVANAMVRRLMFTTRVPKVRCCPPAAPDTVRPWNPSRLRH